MRIILAAVVFSAVALADISQTATLGANTALSLDTGTTASSGGDILWNGSTIAPQNKARAYNFGTTTVFSTFVESQVATFKLLSNANVIQASALVVNDMFFVYTNANHNAKVLVT